jgi:hypothetical protein
VADRRLDALIEEDRRAMSVPVQPGMRRLALDDARAQQPSSSSMAGRGDSAGFEWGTGFVERSEGRKPGTWAAAGCCAAVF